MIGHHGTSRESAGAILETGFNKSQGEQWFGDGVYFFEDDPEEAKQWAIKVKGFVRNYTVLRSIINPANILNLTKRRNWDEFIKIRQQINERVAKGSYKNRIIGDGIAINIMCNKFYEQLGESIDIVMAGVRHPGYDWTESISNIPRMQYQICVRNLECIADTKVEEGFIL